MDTDDYDREAVDQFLREKIDTVPHLEALLIIWRSRPKPWSAADMAERLFLAPPAAGEILEDLARQKIIVSSSDKSPVYSYESEPERNRLLEAVDAIYRSELIRVSRLIHSKPSAAVRAFARAFRIKKDGE